MRTPRLPTSSAANAMVGASGNFTNLHYPNQAQVSGLSDSSSKGDRRSITTALENALHRRHVSIPDVLGLSDRVQSETQTQSVFLFYTVYFKPTLSASFFGGPQYSNTQQFGLPTSQVVVPGGRCELCVGRGN